MLAKRLRFHGHGSLRFLYKNADAYRSRAFTVKAIQNPRRKDARISVVVSKKVHKAAVGRNRMRRRIYEIIRQELPQFHGSRDIAIIVTNAEVIAMPHEELRDGLRELLQQAHVYDVVDKE
ncbi:ribonuclease P protein component [Microbacteriaceae bacterium]|nr:ribonuclease P protein component [Candidatus Saccharibacteria bacterium]